MKTELQRIDEQIVWLLARQETIKRQLQFCRVITNLQTNKVEEESAKLSASLETSINKDIEDPIKQMKMIKVSEQKSVLTRELADIEHEITTLRARREIVYQNALSSRYIKRSREWQRNFEESTKEKYSSQPDIQMSLRKNLDWDTVSDNINFEELSTPNSNKNRPKKDKLFQKKEKPSTIINILSCGGNISNVRVSLRPLGRRCKRTI